MFVTIYAGSATGRNPAFAAESERFARDLAAAGVTIVYGGGRAGLMGVTADAALDAGGEVIGVIPTSLVDAEVAHWSLTALHVVDSMHDRKKLMAELGSCFVALPGGIGTLEELADVWSQLILGHHRKPIMLLNIDGYWEPLLAMAAHMVDTGFIRAAEQRTLIPISSATDLFDELAGWCPPPPRWGTTSVETTSIS